MVPSERKCRQRERPFNQQTFLTFLTRIAPPSVDGYFWVSNDLAVPVDGNGNYFGVVNIPAGYLYAPAGSEVPILGWVNRVGVTGGEGVLPQASFYVPPESNGAWGRLEIRGDSQRNTNTFIRVGTFQ